MAVTRTSCSPYAATSLETTPAFDRQSHLLRRRPRRCRGQGRALRPIPRPWPQLCGYRRQGPSGQGRGASGLRSQTRVSRRRLGRNCGIKRVLERGDDSMAGFNPGPPTTELRAEVAATLVDDRQVDRDRIALPDTSFGGGSRERGGPGGRSDRITRGEADAVRYSASCTTGSSTARLLPPRPDTGTSPSISGPSALQPPRPHA